MKSYSFFIVLLAWLFGHGLSAQMPMGVIRYEFTIDNHRQIPPEREELKAMIPKYRTEHFQLFFTQTESLYKIEIDESAQAVRGGGGMRMMRTPRLEVYTHLDEKQMLIAQDLMGKAYLIHDELELGPWRVGNEIMDIAGYTCMMAWMTDTINNQELTAWFSPQIRPLLGPDRYGSLPGTVLALDINNGERVWVARSIQALDQRPVEIRRPNRGEAIQRRDFDKLMQEQMQRMQSQPGRGRL